MGGAAFALLMLGELGASVFGFGRLVTDQFESYQATGWGWRRNRVLLRFP